MTESNPPFPVPLRVLIVSEPGRDGVFRHVEGLIDFLLAQRVKVAFAYSSRRGSPELDALVGRVLKAGGMTADLQVGNQPSLGDAQGLWRLYRLGQAFAPNVVHAHSSKAGALARLLRWSNLHRVFYTPHAYFGLRPGSHWRDGIYNHLERFLGRTGTTINVSASEAGFARVVLRIPQERLLTIHNGVNVRHFRPATAAQKAEARRALGLPAEGKVLASLSRLSAQKDPHTLYRAFARAREWGAPIHLLHVGTGPDKSFAQELLTPALAPHVTRIDHLSDTRPAYWASDGLILTSRYEGLSLVALEALSCDLPLLLSDVGGNDDLLRCGLNQALRFPAGDVDAAAKAICAWAHHEGGECNHRAIVERYFDQQSCYASILEAYQLGEAPVIPTPALLPLTQAH